jgi:asparagine synthase (glutamine-hydrolysing)
MCHSIELRVPFVDDRLYSVVLNYLESGYNKNKPKRILTDAVGDLPPEIINRKKMGFTLPFDEWMRNGKLGKIVRDNIASINSNFSGNAVKDLLDSLDKRKLSWSRLWALYTLNRFLQ